MFEVFRLRRDTGDVDVGCETYKASFGALDASSASNFDTYFDTYTTQTSTRTLRKRQHTHTHIHTHTHRHTHTHPHTHTHAHTHAHTHTPTHTHTHAHTSTRTQTHTCAHAHTLTIHTRTHTHHTRPVIPGPAASSIAPILVPLPPSPPLHRFLFSISSQFAPLSATHLSALRRFLTHSSPGRSCRRSAMSSSSVAAFRRWRRRQVNDGSLTQ